MSPVRQPGFWEPVLKLLAPVLLAVIGGVVRTLESGRCSLVALLAAMATAGFTGCVVHLALESMSLAAGYKAALTGVAGYAGGDLLRVASRRLVAMAGTAKGEDDR
jgi:hypothetical protein